MRSTRQAWVAAGVVLLCCLCQTGVGGPAFIGTEDQYLYLIDFNEETGALTLKNTSIAATPSFMALHPSKQYIYMANEVDNFKNISKSGGISAYKIDPQTGTLHLINSIATLSYEPIHIALDKTSKWLGLANYDDGSYGTWGILPDFSVSNTPSSFRRDNGSGPDPTQDGPHAHEFVFHPSNRYAVIPDLGTDSWMLYSFDEINGKLGLISQVKTTPGNGPRHFAFHPYLPYAYGLNAIASTITVFQVPDPLHTLDAIQTINTLEKPQPASAGELQFSPDASILYVSNRPDTQNGTIAIFSINKENGKLTNIGYSNTLGLGPRFFNLSRDGRFIIVANQVSNNTRVFERDLKTGMIGKHVSSLDNIIDPVYFLQL